MNSFHKKKLAKPRSANLQKQPPRGVLRKGVLKICSKFTGEHSCRSVIWKEATSCKEARRNNYLIL